MAGQRVQARPRRSALTSKPGFVQKSLSSTAVVASIISGGIWSNVTSWRRSTPNRASSTCAGPVVDDRGLVEADVVQERPGVRQVAAVVGVRADRPDERRRRRGSGSWRTGGAGWRAPRVGRSHLHVRAARLRCGDAADASGGLSACAGRRYHRVRGGPFPPSGRGVDGLRPDPVTPDAVTPSFDPGLGGLIPELRWRGMFHDASDGLEARLATGRSITGYNGFDPVRPVAPHRPPGADLRPDPPAAARRRADRARRWRDRDDRRPVRPLERAQPALAGAARGERRRRCGRSSSASSTSTGRAAPGWRTTSTGSSRFACSSSCATSASTSRSRTCSPRTRSRRASSAACRSPSSATCSSSRPTSSTSTGRSGASCRWAAPTSGATSPPGLELIRRTSGEPGSPGEGSGGQAFALAYPLLLTPSGAKFGKSESGDSVWLHADGTSPYAFYQHWLNTDDRDVPVYLRWFTLFAPAEIEALEAAMAAQPERREAQRALALDLTTRVHGADTAAAAVAASEAAFSGSPILDPAILATLHEAADGFDWTAADVAAGPVGFLVATGTFASKGEARRSIAGGGLTVNERRAHARRTPRCRIRSRGSGMSCESASAACAWDAAQADHRPEGVRLASRAEPRRAADRHPKVRLAPAAAIDGPERSQPRLHDRPRAARRPKCRLARRRAVTLQRRSRCGTSCRDAQRTMRRCQARHIVAQASFPGMLAASAIGCFREPTRPSCRMQFDVQRRTGHVRAAAA